MKVRSLMFTALLPLLLFTSFAICTVNPLPASAAELVIDLRDTTSDSDAAAIEEKLNDQLHSDHAIHMHLNSFVSVKTRTYIADVHEQDMPAIIDLLKQSADVEYVEPNYIYSIPENELVWAEQHEDHPHGLTGGSPNDPFWVRQWSMQMINLQAAWKTSTGKGVVVAVIDTGVAYEDYKNFRKIEDLEGTEFVKPYNFVNDTEHANDDQSHGSHVAGTIAQATNNGIGVAGIAYNAKIMPLKVLTSQGWGTEADISDAIRYAADEGANIINMSLGGGGRSQIMESAVAYAHRKGVVVVCAAGNSGKGKVEYPAAYSGAFAVSSVGPDKELAFYSSWGKEIAISAPGGDKQKGGDNGAILQNTIDPRSFGLTDFYAAFQGTSMATPHVAGVAALVFAAGARSNTEVENILKSTATDLGPPGWDDHYGAGLLNAEAAVKAASRSGGCNGMFVPLVVLLAAAFFLDRVMKRMKGSGRT